MSDGTAESPDRIDAETGKTVAEAIGERLRAHVRPEEAKLPVQLQLLLDQLRAQENTPDSRSTPLSGISNWS